MAPILGVIVIIIKVQPRGAQVAVLLLEDRVAVVEGVEALRQLDGVAATLPYFVPAPFALDAIIEQAVPGVRT